MCTVTVLPLRHGFRIACNRDESNSRPTALPPQLRRFGSRSAIMPIDPISDGTWIAANDAGLAMVLPNRNLSSEKKELAATHPSRGTIIPALLHCHDIHQAKRLASTLVPKSSAPFRLIIVGQDQVAEISVVHSVLRVEERNHVNSPLLFTSSGLGDEVVDGPRRQLFEEWFHAEEGRAKQQDRFHCHSWPGQRHISVCMSRHNARTVSYTVIELRSASVSMAYFPHTPIVPGPGVSVSLALKPMVA